MSTTFDIHYYTCSQHSFNEFISITSKGYIVLGCELYMTFMWDKAMLLSSVLTFWWTTCFGGNL